MSTVPPTVDSIVFDAESYPPGATINATVKVTPGGSESAVTFTGTATDTTTGQTGEMTGTFNVQTTDPTTVTVSDGTRTWAKISDDGTTSVWQATA